MKTEDLVARLAEDASPPRPLLRTLALGLVPGLLVSFGLVWMLLGLRPDMDTALATPMFWMKLAYALALAAIAVPLVLALARPTGPTTRIAYVLLAPVAVLGVMALYRMMNAPPQLRPALLMGSSAQVCSLRIVTVSLPILAGVFLSLRRFAPTRLEWAGAAAGLLSGAAGTFVYALHCTEIAAPFILVWYTLGMLAVGAIGALLGRLTLRW